MKTEGLRARARAHLYGFLARAFRSEDETFGEALDSGGCRTRLASAAAVLDPVFPIAALVAADMVVVIAADWVKPGLGQPLEHGCAVGAAIRQIPHGEEAIPSGVESRLVQRPLQQRKVAVDIADGEISPQRIAGEASDQRGRVHVDLLARADGRLVRFCLAVHKVTEERWRPRGGW